MVRKNLATGANLGNCIGCQQDRACSPGRSLFWPDRFVWVDVSCPVGTVLFAELVNPTEYFDSPLVLLYGYQRHNQLTGFRYGHPGFIVYTSATELVNHKLIPAGIYPV